MKFKSILDKQKFLLEIERLDLLENLTEDWVPSKELLELLLKKRKDLVGKLKNFRKKQAGKENWRKNRYKLMKGIKAFHKSTKGKRFHRSLGTFLATRDFTNQSLVRRTESLKAISSLKTHLFIEGEYYKSLIDEVDFQETLETILPVINDVEKCLLEFKDIGPADMGSIFRFCEVNSIIVAALKEKLDRPPTDKEFSSLKEKFLTTFKTYEDKELIYNIPCGQFYNLFKKYCF